MEKPLVSAVIRTYNRANLLPDAIESVLNQTYKDIEVIIHDDCSTDNTESIVTTYCKKDDRIRYHRQEKNSGTGVGFNTSNRLARGKYIAYLDDDDLWRPDKIEKQVDLFENCDEEVGLVTGSVQYWNNFEESGPTVNRIWNPNKKGNVYLESLGSSGDIFGPPSVVMIKKNVIEDVGDFREDMPRGCCQHYFRKIAKKYKIDYVEDMCLDYYYHREAITHIETKQDLEKAIKSMNIKINDTQSDLEKVPKTYSKELFKLSRFYYSTGDLINARRKSLKALRYNLLNYKALFVTILTFNPLKKIS